MYRTAMSFTSEQEKCLMLKFSAPYNAQKHFTKCKMRDLKQKKNRSGSSDCGGSKCAASCKMENKINIEIWFKNRWMIQKFWITSYDVQHNPLKLPIEMYTLCLVECWISQSDDGFTCRLIFFSLFLSLCVLRLFSSVFTSFIYKIYTQFHFRWVRGCRYFHFSLCVTEFQQFQKVGVCFFFCSCSHFEILLRVLYLNSVVLIHFFPNVLSSQFEPMQCSSVMLFVFMFAIPFRWVCNWYFNKSQRVRENYRLLMVCAKHVLCAWFAYMQIILSDIAHVIQ